jgi:hypothetical protein
MKEFKCEQFGDIYKAIESGKYIYLKDYGQITITHRGILESDNLSHFDIYDMWVEGVIFYENHMDYRYVGSLVKVRDGVEFPWTYDTLKGINIDSTRMYIGLRYNWEYMEPLTEDEKNSIITKI